MPDNPDANTASDGDAREAKAGQPAFDFTPLRKTLGLEGE
jgi:hypothetical protein